MRFVPRGQRITARLARDQIRIAVQGIVAHVGEREIEAGRFDEGDPIGAGSQAGEQVPAKLIRELGASWAQHNRSTVP